MKTFDLRKRTPWTRPTGGRAALLAALAAIIVGGGGVLPMHGASAEVPDSPPGIPLVAKQLETMDCPSRLAQTATCYSGRNDDGSYYTIALPREWNGSLVVHAHGGPGASYDESDGADDLEEWAVMVDEGYAWSASSYRRGGYGVRMAAEDTENARLLFTEVFGQPQNTYLHGQSWGGNVAAKVAETYGNTPRAYDGVLLTNGLLSGGSRGYDHRVDLRAVYQYYCQNLPLASEGQYPIWQGLPADSTLTPEDVGARFDKCTGFFTDPADRTAQQQRNLDDILAVTGIPEAELDTHMQYAAFLFQDIVWRRLDGRNPFSNVGVRYSGSHDDGALNAGVVRFSAEPVAKRDLSYDSDLTGDVSLPVLTLHAIGDPSVYVEHQAAYRATVEAAGHGNNLLQTFTTEYTHNGLSDSEYAASLAALKTWVQTGARPTPQAVAESCERIDRSYSGGCFYDIDYAPAPLHTRIAPRAGGTGWPAMSRAQEGEWSLIGGVGIAP